jgi:hypothetical protein
VECAEIRRGFLAGRVPAGPDVEEHLNGCAACRELFAGGAPLGQQLAQVVLPETDAGELFALVDREVSREVGLRARLRALSTRARAGALLAFTAALVLYHLLLRRRFDFAEFSPAVFWGVVMVLGAALVVGTLRVTRGVSAPVSVVAHDRWAALALLVLPALTLLVVPLGSPLPEAAGGWGDPASCFSYGAALVVPFLLMFWLFERRDDVPVATSVSAGALCGIAANLLLHTHCASVHLGHLLLGHASIGVAWALALSFVSKPIRPASKPIQRER